MSESINPDWRKHIKRDEVFELWRQASDLDQTHSELAESVKDACLDRIRRGAKPEAYAAFEKGFTVSESQLAEWCTQIREGLLRRAEVELTGTNSQVIKNAINAARLMIPTMLIGSDQGSRTSYKNVFERLMRQANAAATDDQQPLLD